MRINTIQCMSRKRNCQKEVAFICHHCGKLLCRNIATNQEMRDQGDNYCGVLINDYEFAIDDREHDYTSSDDDTAAYHCVECASNHRKRAR